MDFYKKALFFSVFLLLLSACGDGSDSDGENVEGGVDGVEADGAVSGVVDENLPSARFVVPLSGQVVLEGETLLVEVFASDDDGSISSVDLSVDGVLIRREQSAPYNWNHSGNPSSDSVLNELGVGEHTLRAVVTDDAGNQTAITRLITVMPTNNVGGNISPLVSFITPAVTQVFNEGDNVVVDVLADDEDGNVAGVDFYFDDIFIRTEVNPPYTWNDTVRGAADTALNNLTAGEHSLRAVVTDDTGAITETAITITVNASSGISQCNDGIDNDGDGLTDWQLDVGCWGAEDQTEAAGTREQENGWTTFDLSSDSRVIYVSSSDGNDANDGLTPETAKATPEVGFAMVRDGFPDFLLLKRGDTWRDTTLTRRDLDNGGVGTVAFKSGRSAEEKLVIASYGDSTERPRLEIETHFVNDHGREYHHFAISGLAFISYKKEPNTPMFDGHSGGAVRLVGNARSSDVLLEDNYLQYGEYVVQAVDDIEIRRNVIYRSYHMGTCAFREDGTRHPFGNPGYRPSGMFMGSSTNGALLEENIWDENGWNPDLPVGDANNPGPCATIYNHNVYLSDVKNITVRNDIFLRASSIGLKVSGNSAGGIDGITIDNNLFAEGEIGISMGGNGRVADTHNNALVTNNVFTDIARTLPTTRSFSWGITIENNNNARYANNLFVNPLLTRNSYAFGLADSANTDIIVENNTVYGYERAVRVVEGEQWGPVSIRNNQFVTEFGTGPLMYHRGDFNNVNYTDNAYRSNYASDNPKADGWFDNIYPFLGVDAWRVRSGEAGALESSYQPVDAQRNVDSYAEYLGIGTSLDDFAREARKQSRFNYRSEFTAQAVNDYIRQGYEDRNGETAPEPTSVDTDNDGVIDSQDAFPNNPEETKDSDNDGIGDNADVFPNDATESLDSDGDGIGDNADTTPRGDFPDSPEMASVISGVAPLAVSFDAGAEGENFHNRLYQWNFGDANAGSWVGVENSEGLPKNTDTGPVNGHLYTKPGTYIASLRVSDTSGEIPELAKQVVITVQDPNEVFAGEKTKCISIVGDFEGCPLGAERLIYDGEELYTNLSKLLENNRVLLHRGEHWVINGTNQQMPSNVYLSAYGHCASPDLRGICNNAPILDNHSEDRVRADATGDMKGPSILRFTAQADNVLIQDIHFTANDRRNNSITTSDNTSNVIFHRLKLSIVNGLYLNEARHYALVDSDLTGGHRSIVYVGGRNLIVKGNHFYDSYSAHLLRLMSPYKSIIAHNVLHGVEVDPQRSSRGSQVLKLHGKDSGVVDRNTYLYGFLGVEPTFSQYTVVANNFFGKGDAWVATVYPTNGNLEELIQDVIVEKNFFSCAYGNQARQFSSSTNTSVISQKNCVQFLSIQGRNITARNNVFDLEGSGRIINNDTNIRAHNSAITIEKFGTGSVAPPPNNVKAYNNTIKIPTNFSYVNSPEWLKVGEDAVGIEFANNLLSKPNNNDTYIHDKSGVATFVNNLFVNDAGFIDASNGNVLQRDYRLQAQSPAVNSGTPLAYVIEDFNGTLRSQSAINIGAH